MSKRTTQKSQFWLSVCLCLSIWLSLPNGYFSMENGLARLPPMGWMSWMKYACNINCDAYPNDCISERLFKDMIDRIAEDGWLELGYNTVNIDDCWSEMKRDPTSERLVPNKKRFNSGIRSLSNYAASRGVQLGIYSDVGNATCEGYPAARDTKGGDYTVIDAQTFNSWNVTSLKLDGCHQDQDLYNETYPFYSKALRKFAPNVVYACSWPAYLNVEEMTEMDYVMIRDNCNYWRNFDDIFDSWSSLLSIIDFYGKHGHIFAKYHGPGGWFDADMLLIGNTGLSYEQSKTQMAFWSLWSVPLLMSNDLRDIQPEMKAILKNRLLIRINQDKLGRMGKKIHKLTSRYQEVWAKELSNPKGDGLAYAVIYFNRQTLGVPAIMSHRLEEIIPNLDSEQSYEAFDVFDNPSVPISRYYPSSQLKLKVPTSGSVRMLLLLPNDSFDI